MVQYVYEIWQFIIHVNGSHGYLFIPPPSPNILKVKGRENFENFFVIFFFMCYLVYRSINNAFNIAVVLGVIFKLTYMSHVGHIVGKKYVLGSVSKKFKNVKRDVALITPHSILLWLRKQ